MIMLILILINLINIICIYKKYYKNNQFTKIDIQNKNSMIIGYIHDRGANNNFDLIMAEIIELNIKDYIKIEYNENSFDKYDYVIKQNVPVGSDVLNKYEMVVLNFLFPHEMEITKAELEEKLKNTFHSYNVQFNEEISILDEELKKENIIDKDIKEEFSKNTKRYIIMSFILVLLISMLTILKITEIPLICTLIYFLEKAVSTVLLLKADLYTDLGKDVEYSINNYKLEIKEKEFLTEKNKMKDIVKNKEFANSIALHINTQAKKAFVDDKLLQEATKMSKKQVINSAIIFAIIVLSVLILGEITKLLPTKLIFWFYLILVLIVAIVADATYLIYKKK